MEVAFKKSKLETRLVKSFSTTVARDIWPNLSTW